jgi:hypothetical protein
MTLNAMILRSEDTADGYVRVVLYPEHWTAKDADRLAIEAFTAAQRANPDEWSWEEYEPELEARGFVVPCWHHGPGWDETR